MPLLDLTIQNLGLVGLWAIVLAESGLFLFFLPGDSLLFTAGYLASERIIFILPVIIGSAMAAVVGTTVGYGIGHSLGPRIFKYPDSFLLNKSSLLTTQKFFKKYGPAAIILARFVPVVRTFVPVMAGVGQMNLARFMFYNILGAIIWVLTFTLLGYYFGNTPIIKDNFTLSIVIVVILSILPMAYHFLTIRRKS